MNPISEEQRHLLEAFKNCFVEQPLATQIFSDFDRLRFYHKLGGSQQCMLITGDAGVGKTEILKHYVQRATVADDSCYTTHRPVLMSRIPSKATLDSTLIELHKDLGQPFSTERRGKSNDQSLTMSLIGLLGKCRTELIIIDEFQELLEFKSDAVRAGIANRLKFISEQAQIPIVLVGMPWAAKIADEPQWGSRLINRRFIPFIRLSENPKHFIKLLKAFARKMPFDTPPNLEQRHTAYALFAASKGSLRALKWLLDDAVTLAVFEGASELTHEHLEKAFDLKSPERKNPFLLPVEEIQACEVDQYSSYDFDAPKGTNPVIDTTFTQLQSISQLLSMSPTLKAPKRLEN